MSAASSRMTVVETLIVIALIVVLGAILLPAISGIPPRERPASCQNNLKQLAFICKMYSNESPGGKLPPMQCFMNLPAYSFAYAMSMPAVFPDYLTDLSILACPSQKDLEVSWTVTEEWKKTFSIPEYEGGEASRVSMSYTYWSHAFDDVGDEAPQMQIADRPAQVLGLPANTSGPQQLIAAINRACERILGSGSIAPIDDDIPVPDGLGTARGNVVLRLRDGVEREWIPEDEITYESRTDAQSRIWIMHDNLFSNSMNLAHIPSGCNVAYLDGHAEFRRFSDTAPISYGVTRILGNVHGFHSGESGEPT